METLPTDLALVLALQAPYVDAPHRRSLEPNAPGEALWRWVSESLVPLLNVLERLEREGIEAPLSIAVSPLLCEMLADIHAAPAYLKYLDRQAATARDQAHFFASRGQEIYRAGCAFWEAWYQTAERDFRETYAMDLLGSLRDFASRDRVELLAMPATLAPLALLGRDSSIRAQLALAVESFKKYFGRPPRGLWTCRELERGQAPGAAEEARLDVARLIAAAGFEYVVEGAATTRASARKTEARATSWSACPGCAR